MKQSNEKKECQYPCRTGAELLYTLLLLVLIFGMAFFFLWKAYFSLSSEQKEMLKWDRVLAPVLSQIKAQDADWNGAYAFSDSIQMKTEILSEDYPALMRNLMLHNYPYLIFTKQKAEKQNLLAQTEQIGYERTDIVSGQYVVYRLRKEYENRFWTDNRNAIVIGRNAKAISIALPEMIYGDREDILDYSYEELKQYQLVYYVENEAKSLYEKEKTEQLILELVQNQTVVFIESAFSIRRCLFDVRLDYREAAAPLVLFCVEDTPIQIPRITILESQKAHVGGFAGDTSHSMISYLNMQNGISGQIRSIFADYPTEEGTLLFVGNRLSEYLLSVYIGSFGPEGKNYANAIINSKRVHLIYEGMLAYCGVRSYEAPGVFHGINNITWNDKEILFSYESTAEREMTLSLPYSKNHIAFVDGVPCALYNKEGLTMISLPEGSNTVEIKYSLTVKDMLLLFIGLYCFVMFVLVIVQRKRILMRTGRNLHRWGHYLSDACVPSKK